jgi:predicted dehydrogenase
MPRLGIGIVGAGFVTGFHLQAFVGVRDADVVGIWSRTRSRAEDAAARARALGVGDTRVFDSIADMVADPAIDAIWICAPNYARVETVEAIVEAMGRGGRLIGIACEKPLGRTVAEAAHILRLVEAAGLRHGYLENQVFAPQIERGRAIIWARGARATGRPYLARAAEEHSGPHAPWFWRGALQGGGVLNDMMCHSALLVRHLLTAPGARRDTLRPVQVSAHIKSLKWTRPEYAARLTRAMGPEVDYTKHPAEDYASMMIEFETIDGLRVVGEATTSWSFVGAGLRLSAELLGPEYSMAWNTLDTGLQLFFSRDVQAPPTGDDLVEKQQADLGLMPVVADEAAAYGYEAENRHMVQAFLRGESPLYTFEDGLEVVKLLMAGYMSAEQGRTLDYPPDGLATFVPRVATGEWT